ELTVEEDARRVRMAEVAHRARLTPEARDQVLPAEVLGVEDLDRDRAVHLGLLGAIDRPHPACADALDDPELIRDLLADVGARHGAQHTTPPSDSQEALAFVRRSR